MEKGGLNSPIVKKIVGGVRPQRKQFFSAPTEVCLEEWWLSKPLDGKGIAVGGIPVQTTRRDKPWRVSHSASAKVKSATREFHSSEIVKRHSCATLETSDGILVSLCGFINKPRTLQNGFSSEVCRDFIYGFPFNWNDFAVQRVIEESNQRNHDFFSDSFASAAWDVCNGAQLHELVLSLSEAERDMFNKKMYNDLMGMLEQETVDDQPSKSQPSSLVDTDILRSKSATRKDTNKRRHDTPTANYTEEEVRVTPFASRKRVYVHVRDFACKGYGEDLACNQPKLG